MIQTSEQRRSLPRTRFRKVTLEIYVPEELTKLRYTPSPNGRGYTQLEQRTFMEVAAPAINQYATECANEHTDRSKWAITTKDRDLRWYNENESLTTIIQVSHENCVRVWWENIKRFLRQ